MISSVAPPFSDGEEGEREGEGEGEGEEKEKESGASTLRTAKGQKEQTELDDDGWTHSTHRVLGCRIGAGRRAVAAWEEGEEGRKRAEALRRRCRGNSGGWIVDRVSFGLSLFDPRVVSL